MYLKISFFISEQVKELFLFHSTVHEATVNIFNLKTQFEVTGNMTKKGADRVGLLLAISILLISIFVGVALLRYVFIKIYRFKCHCDSIANLFSRLHLKWFYVVYEQSEKMMEKSF